jgi:hypothetical protein
LKILQGVSLRGAQKVGPVIFVLLNLTEVLFPVGFLEAEVELDSFSYISST